MAYHIIVVGCGGTGSVFLEKLTRYLANRSNRDIRELVVIDGDVVEEKNLRNQSFIKEDIGLSKACVWEQIVSSFVNDIMVKSFGIYIEKRNDIRLESTYKDDVFILIGACDNHACRLVMESFFAAHPNVLYFDSANEFDTGECVFAAKLEGKVMAPCRSVLFPDLLKGDLRSVRELSCEELNAASPQHMLINQLAAMQLMQGLIKVLEKKEIPTGVTFFNTDFSTQHFPTVPNRKAG